MFCGLTHLIRSIKSTMNRQPVPIYFTSQVLYTLRSKKSRCVVYVCLLSLISSFLCEFKVKAVFLTAFDEMNNEFYTAWNNTVIKQSSTLEEIDTFDFDTEPTLLEIIHVNSSVYIFCCVSVDDLPSCFMTDTQTRIRNEINVIVTDEFALNILRYKKGLDRTYMFSKTNDSNNKLYLSVIQNVVYGTHHKNTTTIAIFTIDLLHNTIKVHESEIIVLVESTIDLHVLSQFYYNENMYFVAKYPKDTEFAGSVILRFDLDNGSVLETAINCFNRSNVFNSVTSNVMVKPDDYLSTSHVYKNSTVICSIKISDLEEYFNSIKSDWPNKIGVHYKLSTRRVNTNKKNPVFQSVSTLFMSQSTSLVPTQSDISDIVVERAKDNTLLAHLLADNLEVQTITLFENSQVISVYNFSELFGKHCDKPEGLDSFDNKLYVYCNKTIAYLDLLNCNRHSADDNHCLRDKVGCGFCQNTTNNNTSFYCGSLNECGTQRILVKRPHVSSQAVQPLIGPAGGGNIIIVVGDELDMETDISINIGDKYCRIIRSSITSSSLQCEAPACDVNSDVRVSITIDGTHYQQSSLYQCVPDPVITEFIPGYVIKSGGTHIRLKGDNLNFTTEDVSLVFHEEDARFSNQRFPCVPEENDLECLLPPINPSSSHTNLTVQLVSQSTGSYPVLLGHIRSRPFFIEVRPDPVIGWDLTFHLKDVALKGNFLDNIRKTDVNIYNIPGLKPIRITSINDTAIVFPKDELETGRRIIQYKVTIGENLVFCRGEIHESGNNTTYTLTDSTTITSTSIIITSDGHTTEPRIEQSFVIIVPVTCVVVFVTVVAIFVTKRLVKRRKHNVHDRHQRPSIVSYHGSIGISFGDRAASRSHSSASVSDGLLTECTSGTSKEILRHLEQNSLIIKRANLSLGKMLGRGNFGSVYKGVVKNNEELLDVAVKTLHQDAPRDIDIQLFLKEAFIMKDFQHENVMTLVGICLDLDDMPLVILPFMEHGDLLSYLHEDAHSPTIKDLVAFGLDIAKGMAYLAHLKFVHRDLAARNCMLDSNYVVKIADFGLSRDIYETSYYSAKSKGTKLPVKWMAIDSLTNGDFNEKTDVWSFGVTLWELMTRGVRPYATVDNWDMERYLSCGRRLPQPLYCPNQLYKVMRKCWAEDPDDRPTFAELQSWISEMLDRVHHQLGNTEKSTNIETTYVNLSIGPSYHYENEEMFNRK